MVNMNKYTKKTQKLICAFVLLVLFTNLIGFENNKKIVKLNMSTQNSVSEFKALLLQLSINSSNTYFQDHCNYILSVIDMVPQLSATDTSLLNMMYKTFADTTVQGNASKIESYTQRQRPFILSWESPTDGATSLAWLILPENWDPVKSYPLYVRLHGYADIYSNPIEYMLYYFYPESLMNVTFEDGYTLLPWGRGNNWYEGAGETDIWESISLIESKMNIDQTRKYLVGFSMGGYGTLKLGEESPGTWAALGIFAGAFQYNTEILNINSIKKIKDVPTYIVCGTDDALLSYNQTAYQELLDAGNSNLNFTTFNGGHVASIEDLRNMYEWIRNFSKDPILIGIGNQSSTDTRFFPNLALSSLHFINLMKNTHIIIINIDGKIVKELDCNAGENSIDIANLHKGIYLLKINCKEENSMQRFIKQ
jgi:predicted esterase